MVAGRCYDNNVLKDNSVLRDSDVLTIAGVWTPLELTLETGALRMQSESRTVIAPTYFINGAHH